MGMTVLEAPSEICRKLKRAGSRKAVVLSQQSKEVAAWTALHDDPLLRLGGAPPHYGQHVGVVEPACPFVFSARFRLAFFIQTLHRNIVERAL